MKTQIESFKLNLISLSKSPNTIRNYISDVNHYFKVFNVINRENILKYKGLINNFSVSTINCKLSALKSFNEYLLEKGLVSSIVILKSDFIKKQSDGNPTDVTEKQVNYFLKRVREKDHIYKSRNIAIIYLIANTGIRREESTNIKLKDLDLENGELLITKGKGNKQRIVLLNDIAIKVLKYWLKDRNRFKYAAKSPYLFVSERSEKLHKDSINDIFEYYYTPKCRVKVHSLRHNFASITQEQGILTLPELQNQLGHSSISTSGLYAHARKDNIKKKINKMQIG
jgi:site-specific recombinase XerD